MAYNYELTTSKVKVRSVVFSLEKRTGIISVEFEYYGKDWTSGSPYPQAKIQSDLTGNSDSGSFADKATDDLTAIGNFWKKHKIDWDAGAVLSSKNWGYHDIKLIIHDEDDNAQTFTHNIEINLDPNDQFLTNTTSSLGDDSTPDVTWTLADMLSSQFSNVPTVTLGGSTTTSLTVTINGNATSGLTGGVYLLNDSVMSSVDWINFNNSDGKAGKAFWDYTLAEFKITAPTMSSGENNYSIDLKCEAI